MKTNEKKAKILTHATKLFSTQGVRSTTIDQIAKHAGIGKGTIYYYYDNKTDILLDCYMRNISMIRSRAFETNKEDSDILMRLQEMLQYIHEETQQDPFVRTLFEEYKETRSPEIEMCFQTSEEDAVKSVKHLLKEGRRNGLLKDVPIQLTAFLIVQMMFTYSLDYPSEQKEDDAFISLMKHMLLE